MDKSWLKKYSDSSLVNRAYEFAKEAHGGVKRRNGDPFIIHCLKTAETLYKWGMDESSIAAALLHDVVEDTKYSAERIKKEFGEEVAFLVRGVTKLKKIKYPDQNRDIENIRKLIISFSKDLRVIMIKLADRLHNLQTLEFMPPEKQKKIAWETTEIYAPLAYRLGMQKLSGDLEDLSFPYLHPEEYKWLVGAVKEKYEERVRHAEKAKRMVKRLLENNNMRPITVDARAKRYSSLYKKLLRYDMDIEKVYDLVALRLIVKTKEECYIALGIIHQKFPPIPRKIKDYISRPKPNGYRSLHTTVSYMENNIIEIQIRTQEMHDENELGIAAHWAYQQTKSSGKNSKPKHVRDLEWVRQLRNWYSRFANPKEFLESIKIDFFKDRIFVITPKNDVIDLPAGATPVDFAYQIHSEIGNRCVGAKVNGRIIPLSSELKSGDMVEIITQKNKKPSEDWLRFTKTSLAKKKIKSRLRIKSEKLLPKTKPSLEFKIINEDQPGYLKQVGAVFGDSKINITYLISQTDNRRKFSAVTLRCDPVSEKRIEKLMVKLKKIRGTREVVYKQIR